MIKYEKIYTDNPFIDELIYFTKTIAVNAIIKDCDKADANESIESLKAADIYIACREGRARFEHFKYSLEFLIKSQILPPAIIVECAKDNTRIPAQYRDELTKARSKDYLENYKELNNYYRNFIGIPPKSDLIPDYEEDFIYLDKDQYSEIYPLLQNPELPIHLMSLNDLLILEYNRVILQLSIKYYDSVYLKYMVSNGNGVREYVNYRSNYFVYLTEDDLLRIPQLQNPELPIHMMNNEDLTILYSHGIIDDLIEQYPDKTYLKFMSDNAIDIYKARKAVAFQILYIPTVSNNELMDRWNTKYEQNRNYTMKTYYSEAYKLYSDYYNNFIIVFIILQTMLDIISEVQEFIARRDIFDDRSIRYLFESYGIPYYAEIPRKYQIAMVKNINTLLKWKASTKNMIDICSLFGFDEIDIFRYYLLRDRRIQVDEDYDNTNDEYQFHYKTIIDENGQKKVVPDNDKNYELKFVRVPIEDKADNYLKDKTAYEDYDIITNQDEFWDGKSNHQDIKSAILDQEFSYTRTKYISIDTMYDLADMSFDLPYFINMLVDDTLKEDYLYVKIPTIKNNHQFRVNDLFVYMIALAHIYNGFEDIIMDSRSKILSILGFNFHVDLSEVQQDLINKYYLLNETDIAGASKFDIPITEVTSFDRLLEIFNTNKDIWKAACYGMIHADNKRIYECYKKIYESCFIQEYTTTFFTLQDGTVAETYSDFLKERDYVLYQSIQDFKSYIDQSSLQTAIANTLVEIVYVLDDYMDSTDFKYILSKFPAVSGDFVRTYMLKIVNFFKSYKVHLLNISTVYKVFDKRENSIKVYEDWLLSVNKNPTDYSTIISEITGDINLTKTDKVKLLEQVYFDIERWEFIDLKDKYEFKDQIAELINTLICDDKVIINDNDGKEFPFAEIEHSYEKDDKFYTLDSIHPEISKIINDKYKVLEQIQISYEE